MDAAAGIIQGRKRGDGDMTKKEAKEIMCKVTFYWELGEQTLTQNQINEAIDLAIKALDQQPCEDAISRADVKKYLSAPDANGDRVIYESDLDLLSPITPQPKTGHWTRVTDKTGHLVWECDKCGWQQRFSTNFCPDCGARM